MHAITGLNGGPASQAVTDSRFEVQLNNGQTWVLYASSPITLSLSGGALQASGTFTGSLRAALLDVAGESTLDAHAGRIPTGGTVGATAQSDVGTITFDWETTGAGPLLMMALPHHLDVLQGASTTGVVRNTIKGDMVGISGLTWTMLEPLTTIGFEAPQGIAQALEQSVRTALYEDVNFGVTAGDPYYGGKQFSALARLDDQTTPALVVHEGVPILPGQPVLQGIAQGCAVTVIVILHTIAQAHHITLVQRRRRTRNIGKAVLVSNGGGRQYLGGGTWS